MGLKKVTKSCREKTVSTKRRKQKCGKKGLGILFKKDRKARGERGTARWKIDNDGQSTSKKLKVEAGENTRP